MIKSIKVFLFSNLSRRSIPDVCVLSLGLVLKECDEMYNTHNVMNCVEKRDLLPIYWIVPLV